MGARGPGPPGPPGSATEKTFFPDVLNPLTEEITYVVQTTLRHYPLIAIHLYASVYFC